MCDIFKLKFHSQQPYGHIINYRRRGLKKEKRKGLLFTLGNRIYLKASFQPGRARIIIGTHCTWPGFEPRPSQLGSKRFPD